MFFVGRMFGLSPSEWCELESELGVQVFMESY